MSTQKVVLVTGSNSGFGRLTVELFARSGWRVFGAMRNVAGVNAAAAAELRAAGIEVVELDVTDDASVAAAATVVERAAGALDVLVNNAGAAHFGILEAFSVPAVERQFATNVFGPLRVNRAFLPAMRARKSGLVVFVSSVVGRIVMPFGGVYAASKWALEALAETSSYELAPFNVDVAIVEPGAYATGIFGNVNGADDAARIADYGEVAQWASLTPARIEERAQGTDPGDVARAILALAEAINAAVAPIQRAAAASLGIEALLPKVRS